MEGGNSVLKDFCSDRGRVGDDAADSNELPGSPFLLAGEMAEKT